MIASITGQPLAPTHLDGHGIVASSINQPLYRFSRHHLDSIKEGMEKRALSAEDQEDLEAEESERKRMRRRSQDCLDSIDHYYSRYDDTLSGLYPRFDGVDIYQDDRGVTVEVENPAHNKTRKISKQRRAYRGN